MNRSLTSSRAARRVASLALGLSLVWGSGCAAGGEEAATVDGVAIDAGDVTAQVEAFLDGGQVAAEGAGEGTANAQLVADILTSQVILQLIEAEADERGLEVTEEHREAAFQQLQAQYSGAEPGSGEAVVAALPDDLRENLVEQNAARLALTDDLAPDTAPSEEELRAAYEANADQFTQACLNVILANDVATAELLADAIAAGIPFAEAAMTQSLDPATAAEGGDVGCVSPGQLLGGELDRELFSAAEGTVLDPLEIEGGAVLVQVRELQEASFEEVREQLAAQLEQSGAQAGDQALAQFLMEALAEADVSVAARFGQWDPTLGVISPAGPQAEGPQIEGPLPELPAAPAPPPPPPPPPPPAH